MIAWYFSTKDKKLRYGDNRQIRKGRTHKVKGTPRLCEHGLHASERLIDALKYAPDCYLWKVELGGKMAVGNDKIAATERTYIEGFNAEKLLREFARKQALINIEKIKPYCSKEDYTLILEWLNTGKESLKLAAESAAWLAAESPVELAAESAAELAARSAAWSAAWSSDELAAWSAVKLAAWSAAKLAAELAAESAAWSADELAARSAAELAAWSAARSAAWSAADDMLTEMVEKELDKLNKSV